MYRMWVKLFLERAHLSHILVKMVGFAFGAGL